MISIGIFASYQAGSDEVPIGSVSIWGTLDERLVQDALGTLSVQDLRFDRVMYRQIDEANFRQRTLEGFATGNGPDLMLIDETQLYYYLDKIYAYEPETFPVSTY